MEKPHYSLSWDLYSKNFCNEIVQMQQSGDLVDMTIAADGHLVKVHKMVMCLVSPYIKELLSTAPCSHPVIFLNKVSYRTLCLLLEYIYTGTVQVPHDELNLMIEAGTVLHVKGLQDLDSSAGEKDNFTISETPKTSLRKKAAPMKDSPTKPVKIMPLQHSKVAVSTSAKNYLADNTQIAVNKDTAIDDADMDSTFLETETLEEIDEGNNIQCNDLEPIKKKEQILQYTISNQGKLQIILNRFMYRLIWVYTNPPRIGVRRWICVENDNRSIKCTALVFTRDGNICKRRGLHNHPFHDERIMKKIQKGAVYTVLQHAEEIAKTTTNNKNDG